MPKTQSEMDRASPAGLLSAVWTYTGRMRLMLFTGYALTFIVNVAKLLPTVFAGMMINIIQVKGATGLGACKPLLVNLVIVLLFIWAIRIPLKLMQFRLARSAQNTMVEALNRRLLSAPLSWHEARHSGDTASRIGQSTGSVFAFTLAQFAMLESILLMTGPIVALFVLSPLICGVALGGYIAIGAICLSVDHFQGRFWIRESDAHRAFGTSLVDLYRNILSIFAARRQSVVGRLLQERLGTVFRAARTNLVITEFKWSGIDIVTTSFGLGLMVVYISLFAKNGSAGRVELGNVYMVQAYVSGGIGALLAVIGNVATFMRQRTDFAAAAPILAIPVPQENHEVLAEGWGELALRGVVYSYGADHTAPALRGVELQLRRGRRYALVGRNGSGKSTLLKVLSGLAAPHAGEILVDGQPASFPALRNSATLVPQNPELLNGTIRENLFLEPAHGPDGTPADQDRILDLLIQPLGGNLEAQVVEGGGNWSGGQRQRIALARGLLSALESHLVLVDEPTSSVDAIDERVILDRLSDVFSDKCLVVSLHSLELIDRFDEVVVMADGAIVDVGPPAAVRARCEYFRESFGEGVAALAPALT